MPGIFLSHSGKQKAFVEHLYDDLLSANHKAFFDIKDTLPKGSRFPDIIKRAARGCKLGVVVLSNDFLTSKWPMLELEMLVLERDPKAIVLPLFYKISPEELGSPEKLSEWRCVWKEKAGQHADQWERAVKGLRSFNGEVFIPGTSEVAYIKRVVHLICNLVQSSISYDLSPIQGHQRFAKVLPFLILHPAHARAHIYTPSLGSLDHSVCAPLIHSEVSIPHHDLKRPHRFVSLCPNSYKWCIDHSHDDI